MVKEFMFEGATVFWFPQVEVLLLTADDQSIVEAEELVFVAALCAGRRGMVEGVEGCRG
jgi:hypothetical protein